MLRIGCLALTTMTLAACAAAPTRGANVPAPTEFVPTDAPFDRAFSAYAHDHELHAWTVPVRHEVQNESGQGLAPAPTDVVAEGLVTGEAIVVAPPAAGHGAQLAFRTLPREYSCEPSPQVDYRVAGAADGTVVVVRLVPRVHVTTEHHAGTCGVGCGPAPPPPVSRLLLLPETKRVRVVAVPWDAEVVRVTCDDEHPRQ